MSHILDELLTTLPLIAERQRKHYCSLEQRRLDCGTLLKIVDQLLTERKRLTERIAEYERKDKSA